MVLGVDADGVRDGELSRAVALAAPGANVLAGGRVAVDVVVAVAVGDDDIAIGGDGDVGGAVEGVALVGAGLAGGAEGQEEFAFRAEFVDGVVAPLSIAYVVLSWPTKNPHTISLSCTPAARR